MATPTPPDREFIARVEAATPEQFAALLRRPTVEQDGILRAHLGPERYERMRRLALQAGVATRGAKKGNVVVLHGIMGGELTVHPAGQKPQHIWLHILRLINGAVGWLRMNNATDSAHDVRPTGILKKWYGEMLLGLQRDWNVQAFPFDWRKDLRDSADRLAERIDEWFGAGSRVHFVAHSMGGMVVRTFILRHEARWRKCGRLIMLGTPNHGSFAIPQVAHGAESTVRKLAQFDFKHSLSELLGILNSFPGSFQMLPSPFVMPSMERLYDAKTYGALHVAQALLDNGRRHHDALRPIADGERMSYIAGCRHSTYDDIRDWSRLNTLEAYSASDAGDGTVPHRLGFLAQDGKRIPTYFVLATHGGLPNDASVIGGCREILESGSSSSLPQTIPAAARGASVAPEDAELHRRARRTQAMLEETRATQLAQRLRAQSSARGVAEADPDRPPSAEEREAEELLVSSFLAPSVGVRVLTLAAEEAEAVFAPAPVVLPALGSAETPAAATQREGGSGEACPALPAIEIALVYGSIEDERIPAPNDLPVDAVAVGHYIGVRPQFAELALDRAISAAAQKTASRRKGTGRGRSATRDARAPLILTNLTDRHLIRGELGQPFFLPDPRDPGRVVAIAGMGQPGRFRESELTVLAQHLCWSLAEIGKRHLATVLIGSGAGNLGVAEAMRGWVRGIRRTIRREAAEDCAQLERITFVERNPQRLPGIEGAIRAAAADRNSGIAITYVPPSRKQREDARAEAEKRQRREFADAWDADSGGASAGAGAAAAAGENEPEPVRITINQLQNKFEFSALTKAASIPQRDVPIKVRIVATANDELAAAHDLDSQLERGRFIEQLLLPDELSAHLYRTDVPVVLILDATTARLHWEMFAPTEELMIAAGTVGSGLPKAEAFLGTGYGVTRQLRTTFAPAPELPAPLGRPFRVLVVADPCAEAPLAGAQEEGEAVATIFEQFAPVYAQRTGCPLHVERLLGPAEATPTAVLRKLINERFDVLHYAGHCFFHEKEPALSGWLFSDDQVLSAYELNRIDRIPRFVFSNACESGLTPDRSQDRHAAMAPSFAEAFFARGVTNFVCTAWPVGDGAALDFSRRLYEGLLGLHGADAQVMYRAMREARALIAGKESGVATWGAYQHYGDPYFRLLPAGEKQTAAPAAEDEGSRGAAKGRTAGSGDKPPARSKSRRR